MQYLKKSTKVIVQNMCHDAFYLVVTVLYQIYLDRYSEVKTYVFLHVLFSLKCVFAFHSVTLIASVQNLQIKMLDVNARIVHYCHSVSLHFQHIMHKHILVTILTPTTICIYVMNEWIFHKVVSFGRMWNDKHNQYCLCCLNR